MTSPRQITRRQLQEDPYLAWNEFVHLLAMSDYSDLTARQRQAHLVFWYEHEVQNGGHRQYFDNQGTGRIQEVIHALMQLHADCQAQVLSQAANQYSRYARAQIQFLGDFVSAAMEGEFDEFDKAFHACEPSLVKALQAYLEVNRSEFIMEVDS